MLFILPIGIIVYFFDKKVQKENQKKFDKIDEMYYQNGYTIVSRTDRSLVVEKKHFNLGVLLIFFGALAYFGLPLYYLYYRFILKPKKTTIAF